MAFAPCRTESIGAMAVFRFLDFCGSSLVGIALVKFKYLSRNAIQLRAVLQCSGCARTLANHQQYGRRAPECATTMLLQWPGLPREKTAEGVPTQCLQRPDPRLP